MKKSCNKQEGKLAYPYEPALSNLSCVFRFPEDMRAARAVAWAFEWPFRILFGYVCKLPLLFLRGVNLCGVLQASYLTETSEDVSNTLQRFNNWRRTSWAILFFRINIQTIPRIPAYMTGQGMKLQLCNKLWMQHAWPLAAFIQLPKRNGHTHSIAQMHRIYTLDS
jgi:hypothetical protein